MTEKCKLNDLAKDLGVSNKELIDLLEKKYGEQKKATAVLVDKELNFVIEHYSQKGAVESFDEYFADGEKRRSAPKPEKPQQKAPRAPKAEAKAPAAQQKPAEKSAPKPAEAPKAAGQPHKDRKAKKPAAAR